jgi:serine/threonine protein kinase
MVSTLPLGTILQGQYCIVRVLGIGGMGAVYRAYDLTLNRSCALKEMVPPPGLGATEIAQLRQQFHQEASTLASPWQDPVSCLNPERYEGAKWSNAWFSSPVTSAPAKHP